MTMNSYSPPNTLYHILIYIYTYNFKLLFYQNLNHYAKQSYLVTADYRLNIIGNRCHAIHKINAMQIKIMKV